MMRMFEAGQREMSSGGQVLIVLLLLLLIPQKTTTIYEYNQLMHIVVNVNTHRSAILLASFSFTYSAGRSLLIFNPNIYY